MSDMTAAGGRLDRLKHLKQIQGRAAAASRGRVSEKAHDASTLEILEEIGPKTAFEAVLDNLKRLAHPLVQHAGWSADDVSAMMGITSAADAEAMKQTLMAELSAAGLEPPSPEEWQGMQLGVARTKQEQESSRLRAVAKQREARALRLQVGDLPIADEDLKWAAGMMELIPEREREAVRQEWLRVHQLSIDPATGEAVRESDRYRNANLALLAAAEKFDAERLHALQHAGRHKMRGV